MCGIVGLLNKRGSSDPKVVEDMMRIISHRGPDDTGIESFSIGRKEVRDSYNNLCVGFVRLSIRDLSLAGHQPMRNEAGDITIAFNGEIYNADELREPLLKEGIIFRSTSDTEVLLRLYEKYGIDQMLSKLDGMYAICIVDSRKDCFYLVRDRIGEKPLYIYNTSDVLLFASEYKAFYYSPHFKAELNSDVVDEYFLFRYIAGGDTLLKGVRNINPGCYLKISNNSIEEIQYWDLPHKEYNNNSFEENIKLYNLLLSKSLKRRLISDRKVGLQLSGGVDSSYLAHLAVPMIKESLHTFSIIFSDDRYSEEKYINIVNEKEHTVPHKFVFSSDMFFNCWRECTWFFEAPMNHEGTLGLLFLNKKSRDYITVMLCGEGADETIGGYERFASQAYRLKHRYGFQRFIQDVKYIIRNHSLPDCKTLDEEFISHTQYVSDRVYKLLRDKGNEKIKEVYRKRKKLLLEAPGSGLRKYVNYEIKTYMQDLLMRADKVSMASSIEVRVPYIMPELVEFACSIPTNQLISPCLSKKQPHNTKLILKKLCAIVYGDDFTYREKSGFALPIDSFFKDEKVSSYLDKCILPGIKKRGVLNYPNVERMWVSCKNNKSMKFDEKWGLWCAFSFEMWAQMYLDRKPQDWKHIDF